MIYFPPMRIVKNVKTVFRYTGTNHLVLPIPKNGGSTLAHCFRTREDINNTTLDKLDREERYEIDVFIRNPMDRFIAGIITGFYRQFNESKDRGVLIKCISDWIFIDRHLMPQYFTILKCFDYCPHSVLTFHSYKDIPKVLGTDIHENKTPQIKKDQMLEWLHDHNPNYIENVHELYKTDRIMWDEFLNDSFHFDEIRERFKKEIEFFEQFIVGQGFLDV